MKAVQLTTSGDYSAHYFIDDHESWKREIRMHEGLSLERFQYREVPDPYPKTGEVLVEIWGCGLNHLEVWAVQCPPDHRRSEPRIPGVDIAGLVRAVGEGVKSVKTGDRVVLYPFLVCHNCYFCLTGQDNLCESRGGLGSSRDGGLAEYTVAPEWNVVPLAACLSLSDAASLPIAFLTAWHMLVARARVRPGETVLVSAAGSGVGIAAIQIARLLGARVLVSAGSKVKIEKALALGAEAGVNYRTSSWHEELMCLTGGRGVDVVVDSLSGEVMEQSVEALARGGRLVNCGCTLGNWARINVARMLQKEATVMSSVLGAKHEFLSILRQFEAGRLKPVVDKVFPLSRTREAVAHLAERNHFGKVVVVPDSKFQLKENVPCRQAV